MTITKNVLKFYDISLDKQTQFGTISQQPTANSQQINFNQNNILFSDSAFLLRAVSEFILAIRSMFCSKTFRSFALRIHRWLLFFYAYCEVIEVYKRQKNHKGV